MAGGSNKLVEEIIKTLGRYRFDVTDEKVTQSLISSALLEGNLAHEREYCLGDGRSIIDFFIKERALTAVREDPETGEKSAINYRVQGIGIEVKLDGGAHDIYRQLERYCKSGKLSAIILVTNRAMGLPKEIAGVPAYYFPLGRGWL